MNFKDFALTPPMGWNSWDCFGSSVNEDLLLSNAEFMAQNLKEYGWEYVVCDIQWYQPTAFGTEYVNFADLTMDGYSRLIPAENRFPSSKNGKGFKVIADKIHKMGLKFGIHMMRGIPRQAVHNNTPIKAEGVTARDIAKGFSVCSWNTDMYGINEKAKGAQEYYDSVIELYASWGVDFIKCDDISNTEFKPHDCYSGRCEIEMLRKAIDKCGRNIVLSLSPGPAPLEYGKHLSKNANMWRMTGDFWDSWNQLKGMFERCDKWQSFVENGNYPDCDMLPLGRICIHSECGGRNTNFTFNEQVTMLTLWSIFRSPLMLGCNLPDCDEKTLSLITNRAVLNMNQTLKFSDKIYENDNIICWYGESDEQKYFAIFNIDDTKKKFKDFLEIGLTEDEAEELWSKEKYLIKKDFHLNLEPHSTILLMQS